MSVKVLLLFFNLLALNTAFETQIIDSTINEAKTQSVNSSVQLIFHFRNVVDSGLRVYTYSAQADQYQPLIFTVRQEKGVVSWQIPFYVRRSKKNIYDHYPLVNRTLCPIDNHPKLVQDRQSDVFISVSTSSVHNISFEVLLHQQKIFQVTKINEEIHALVSPSSPIYFQVNLPLEVDSALIKFTSPDDVCSILSVQNVTCPVYDLDLNIKFEGIYQTVNEKAGLTLTRAQYPNGFYLVFVAKTDDVSCRKYSKMPTLLSGNSSATIEFGLRTKRISFTISRKITNEEYLQATFGAIGLFVLFYVVVIMISCVLCIKDYRMGVVEDQVPIVATIEVSEENESQEEGERSSSSTLVSRHRHNADPDQIQVCEEGDTGQDLEQSETSSLNESEIDFVPDALSDIEIIRTKTFMYVSDLARKSNRALAKKSSLYNWNLMTIAIFYGLPVVQLVLTYQNVTNQTGNQDMCYYNFLCAHPLGLVTDFNHIFSNLGYVMLGILFILIVSRKDFRHQKLSHEHRKKYGIPQHFGMYYAMGLALIMEGIMSGCYHVCPNHTNFQFDTAFMYTISILILLKIYQTRHPDINANAYTAFGVLAFIIFIGVIGVLHGNVYFWIFFTGLHCLSCLLLSIQIYYMGRWKLNCGIFKRVWIVCVNDVKSVIGGHWRGLKPMYPDRFFLLVLLNIVNWSLSGYGAGYLSSQGTDFASFLLAIFISNVLLYTMFYIVMKLRYGERIGAQPALYILISTLTWFGSFYFFLNKSTSWTETPAESRALNQECELFHFYDNHDIWHFLSATSLFLSFMILFTLDDDLENVPRDKIPVF